jgi:predicted enzyme related to lactoylglutathione lyase
MAAHLKAKVVFYDVPASDLDASRKFYGALLGTDEFAPSPTERVKALFRPISADGIDMTLHQKADRPDDPPDVPITYFAVDSLAEAQRELESLGGKVVHPPTDIPLPTGKALENYQRAAKAARHKVGKRIGQALLMLDPDENPLGLVELEAHAAFYFRAGPYHHPLRADQVEGLKIALQG